MRFRTGTARSRFSAMCRACRNRPVRLRQCAADGPQPERPGLLERTECGLSRATVFVVGPDCLSDEVPPGHRTAVEKPTAEADEKSVADMNPALRRLSAPLRPDRTVVEAGREPCCPPTSRHRRFSETPGPRNGVKIPHNGSEGMHRLQKDWLALSEAIAANLFISLGSEVRNIRRCSVLPAEFRPAKGFAADFPTGGPETAVSKKHPGPSENGPGITHCGLSVIRTSGSPHPNGAWARTMSSWAA